MSAIAEVLAAMVFMAILIPVIGEGVTIANRAAMVARGKALAVELGDSLLNEMIVTDEWRQQARTGGFGDDYPGVRWEFNADGWELDTMQSLNLLVLYEVQGREYSVRLTTLVAEESAE